MRHRERDELREPLGTVAHGGVRRDRAPVVSDQHGLTVTGEGVGQGENVERDRRGLIVAVGREAGGRVAAEPRGHHVIARGGELGHQQIPGVGVVGEPVQTQREGTVGRSRLEVREVDVVDHDVCRLSHGTDPRRSRRSRATSPGRFGGA